MCDYKEQFIRAKEILDKRMKRIIEAREKELKKLQGNIPTETKLNIEHKNKLTIEYANNCFNKNRHILVDDTLEYFISCMIDENQEPPFSKCHGLISLDFPMDLEGIIWEDKILENIRKLIHDDLKKLTPDFCEFNVECVDEEKVIATEGDYGMFSFGIRIIMYVSY